MLKLIVCIDKNKAIGKKGELGFRLPSDLRNFKEMTTGKIVVYGDKTIQSMGGKALPNRKNIVHTFETDKTEYFNGLGIEVDTPASVVEKYKDEEVFICGGGQIYKEYLTNWWEHIDNLIITVVNGEIEGADTFFPYDLIKWDRYQLKSKDDYVENGVSYSIYNYKLIDCLL